MIQFKYTILYVQDVERSLQFYEKAFALSRTFISPDQHYGELNTGNSTLSFAVVSLAKSNFKQDFTVSNLQSKPFGFEIGFTTDDVQRTLDPALAAGAVLASEPKQKPWGQTVSYVRDPDGFLIEICTPMN